MAARPKKMSIGVCALVMALLTVSSPGLGQSASKTEAKSFHSGKNTDFDASRAYDHVKNIVELGPHPSGSEAIKKAQDYITKEFQAYGLKITEDRFIAKTPRSPVPMKNILAEVPGEKPGVIIIAGHYDTKL